VAILKVFLFCSPYDKHSHYISDADDAKIIESNLKNMEVSLGESLNLACRSNGKPEPETLWYKVGIQMANHSMYKVFKHNCATFISMDDLFSLNYHVQIKCLTLTQL
jgi:hypothetical protein